MVRIAPPPAFSISGSAARAAPTREYAETPRTSPRLPSKSPMAAGVYCRAVRIAVVTGGSSGIGAATARALTRRGWRCVLLARGRERLERVAAELDTEFEQCDVSDRARVEKVAAWIRERHPAVHLLVNNAGVSERRDFLELPPERIEEVMRINYLGGV